MKKFTLFFILLITSPVLAQNLLLKGTVTANNTPIPFANVYLKNTGIGSTTDSKGNFEVEVKKEGTYTLLVSVIGFDPFQEVITVTLEQEIERNISLNKSIKGLNEFVVSGTMRPVLKSASPVPVEVYSPAFFRANPNPSVFESLQNINGVRPQINCNVCNTGDIHINGLEGPYTMVLIDGMPIVSGLSTVYGLNGIPSALIEQVEIVKGPASTLYGSEAVGGLINVITKIPENSSKIAIDMYGTSWGETNSDLGFKYGVGKKANGIFGVNYFNYQNPIDKNNDNFTDITLQNRISLFNKVDLKRNSKKAFSLGLRYIYEDRWGGEMNWGPEFRGGNEVYGESIYTSRWEGFGVYQLPTSEDLRFQFSANGHNQNSVYGDIKYLADQYIGFGQFIWNKSAGKHSVLTGLAYRYTHYDDNTPATGSEKIGNTPSITHLPGLFVQDEITLNESHSVLLGVRYDHNSIHGSIITPRVNYKYVTPNLKNTFRLTLGNGYRVANVFTEDHAALTGARDVIFESELNPERSWNINLNYVHKIYRDQSIITFDGTVFYTYFSNRIVPDYESNPTQIIYGNLDGHAESKGVSLNADLLSNNGWTAAIGATLMDVSLTEGEKTTRQLLTEKFSGVWNIGYKFETIGLKIDYTGNVYSPMRLPLLGELDPRPEYSDWYSVQNIKVTKSFGKYFEVYGGVKNLLNFTPPANSIARANDPFDKNVSFDDNGNPISTAGNPYALTFDPSYVYAPNQGLRGFIGFRYTLD